MAKKQIDLSALAAPVKVDAAEIETGAPLKIALSDIQEDPDQPRREFNADKLADLVSSVRHSGVKSPVSIRPHPDKASGFTWMLNYGARRFRASVEAGLETIPAFVDKSHGSYEQVVENLQRDDLSPLELAQFIQRQIKDGGETKAAIAKGLGKSASFVALHLALVDMPDNIKSVYESGRCRSPRTLYELIKLNAKSPVEVESWLKRDEVINRRSVEDLAADMSQPESQNEEKLTNSENSESEPQLTGLDAAAENQPSKNVSNKKPKANPAGEHLVKYKISYYSAAKADHLDAVQTSIGSLTIEAALKKVAEALGTKEAQRIEIAVEGLAS